MGLNGSVAGVATYVAAQLSPLNAQVDCLGNGDDDIDREGRSKPLSVLICMYLTGSFWCLLMSWRPHACSCWLLHGWRKCSALYSGVL